MKKGISLITISVSILILLVLSTVVVVSLTSNYNKSEKVELANELDMLQIAVDNYKLNNGSYPITDESIVISNVSESIKNTQFIGEKEQSDNTYLFSTIDISKLGIKSLKNGTGTDYNDKYVVSVDTGKVYYAKGKQIGNDKYYGLGEELAGIVEAKNTLEKNSDNPVKFEDKLIDNKLNLKAYVPKIYTVQSVTYENNTVNLKATEDLYYVYEVEVTTIGTLTVNYNYNGETKVSKYSVDESKLNFTSPTKNIYTLTFDANTGTTTTDTITATEGYAITLPTAQKTEHRFLGWFTSKTGGTQVNYTTMPAKSETLYANWLAKVTLTYNANGGSCSTASFTDFPGESVTLPSASRSEYRFLGWYTSASGGSKVNYTTMPTTSQTLYAHWELLNRAPSRPSISVTSRDTSSITFSASSYDSDGDTLTYTFYMNGSYIGSRSGSYSSTVSITATGLPSYTVYPNCYVTVSDGKAAATSYSITTGTGCNNGYSSSTCTEEGPPCCSGQYERGDLVKVICDKCGNIYPNIHSCNWCGSDKYSVYYEWRCPLCGYHFTGTDCYWCQWQHGCTGCKTYSYTSNACEHGYTEMHFPN